MTTNETHDGRHDFDFLTGEWNVHHRKLTDMADPACDTWVEFDGVQWARPLLGGLGNVDNLRIETMPNGSTFEGATLRLFDVAAGVWKIWWTSTSAPGQLDPPVSGRWEGKQGEFRGEDTVGGQPILVRFVWTVIDADTATWEQEFSFDEGGSWVHNWRMSFTRTA